MLFVFEKINGGRCPRDEGGSVNFYLAFTNNNVHTCVHRERPLFNFITVLIDSFICRDEETESQSQDPAHTLICGIPGTTSRRH